MPPEAPAATVASGNATPPPAATAGSSGAPAAPSSTGAPAATPTSTGVSVEATGGSSGGSVAWPDGWRQGLAGDDDKLLKRLERFQSPADILKSYRALEAKISSGELKSALKADATEAEIKAWRTDNGVPEAADGYLDNFKLPDGSQIDKEDQPILKEMAETALALNLTPQQYQQWVASSYDRAERDEQAQAERDKELTDKAIDTLRLEWGADYRTNTNLIETNLTRSGIDKDQFMRGRLADGTPIGSSPEVLKWIVANEREINPGATLVPNSGANIATSIEDEIQAIEGLMRTNRAEYNKDEAKQQRLRDLYAAREKHKAKAG